MSDSDGRCQGSAIVGLERTDRVSCERFTKLILYRLLRLVSKKFQDILSTMSCIVQSGLYQQHTRDITGSNVPKNSCPLYSCSTYATQRSYYAIISSPSAWIFIANGHERVPRRHDKPRRKRKPSLIVPTQANPFIQPVLDTVVQMMTESAVRQVASIIC